MISVRDRPAIVRALTANKGLKAIALLLAVVVWYGIREAISFESELIDVPVEILQDEGWSVLDQSDTAVDIRFRGARADVGDITTKQVRVIVDARGQASGGLMTMPVSVNSVEAPPGARAIQIRPNTVSFRLDREGERQVPVKAELQGNLPEGYAVDSVVCSPVASLLKGPMARLEAVDTLRTVPIDLEGRVQSFRVRKPLVSPSTEWTSRMDPDRVVVDVTITEHAAARTLEGVTVNALLPAGEARRVAVTPGTVTVSLQGRQDVLRTLAPEALQAYIDCTRLEALARYDLPVEVHAPAGVRAVTVEPPTVSVTVEDGHGAGRL